MGIGMQIVYLGFAGSAQLEAEAGVQLIRLERFGAWLDGCRLTVGTLDRGARFEARLDLMLTRRASVPVPCRVDVNPHVAIRLAFDTAERELHAIVNERA